ncbi:MAG: LacI family transcriptional regulator [Bifidobacteriaceae bacterium]|nr:LacI family transcriptional regulator [Bifidobacteriaceae bacterium]
MTSATRDNRTVTMRDVAKHAGVSLATVSRVLSGSETVDAQLAQRVAETVAELGYMGNTTGRILRRQVADTWAVVLPDLQIPFFGSLVSAIEETAVAHGISLMVHSTGENPQREQTYLRRAVEGRVAGIVLAATSNETDLSMVLNSGTPFVQVDRASERHTVHGVFMNNDKGGELAADHFFAQRYRRPACIATVPTITSTEHRLRGFTKRLREIGLDLPEELIRRVPMRPEAAEMATRSLLAQAPNLRPDCIFATNGHACAGAFLAIGRNGQAPFPRVGLIGSDDEVWMRMVTPSVTTLAQPVREMGRMAAEMLVAQASGIGGRGQLVVLPPSLLIRESTPRLID